MAVVVPALTPPVRFFVACLNQVLRSNPSVAGIRVSSWMRTTTQALELSEAGRGVGTRSLHNKGLAMDLVGTPLQLAAMRAGWVALGLDALDEGDHLHVELDGPGLRLLGLDFR